MQITAAVANAARALFPFGALAQLLGAAAGQLRRKAAGARGGGRTRRQARLSGRRRLPHEVDQPLIGVLPVALLGAETARRDDDHPLRRHAPSGEAAQPRARRFIEA